MSDNAAGLDTTWARRFDGVSGPGISIADEVAQFPKYNGYGGWRSGSTGVRYKGNHPKDVYDLNWGSTSTGSAVNDGLVPPILPTMELHVRDAVVTLGGDGNYYMTGSTGDNIWAYAKGIELWKSPDLMSWEYVGLVWDIDKEADEWVKEWRAYGSDKKQGVRAVWAPEIHYLPQHNNYYICFSMCPGGVGLLKSATGKAEGPYVNAWAQPNTMVVDGIDPTLFEDEDGIVYFTYSGAGKIYKMNDDLSAFDGKPVTITLLDPDTDPSHHADKCVGRGMKDLGHEGAVLFKYKGRYYLGAADSYEGRYSTCLAMADNIYGPYSTRHEPIPCDGGTNFFVDKEGELWSSYFGNDSQTHFREKHGLVKAQVLDDGRIIPAREQPHVPEKLQKLWGTRWDKRWKPLTTAIENRVTVDGVAEDGKCTMFDAKGVCRNNTVKGLNIVRQESKDGTVKTSKIYK